MVKAQLLQARHGIIEVTVHKVRHHVDSATGFAQGNAHAVARPGGVGAQAVQDIAQGQVVSIRHSPRVERASAFGGIRPE